MINDGSPTVEKDVTGDKDVLSRMSTHAPTHADRDGRGTGMHISSETMPPE